MFPLLFDTKERRDKVVELFNQRNIGHRIYYSPLHLHPEFGFKNDGTLSKTEDLYNRILCIPFFETMSVAEMAEVVETLELAWK